MLINRDDNRAHGRQRCRWRDEVSSSHHALGLSNTAGVAWERAEIPPDRVCSAGGGLWPTAAQPWLAACPQLAKADAASASHPLVNQLARLRNPVSPWHWNVAAPASPHVVLVAVRAADHQALNSAARSRAAAQPERGFTPVSASSVIALIKAKNLAGQRMCRSVAASLAGCRKNSLRVIGRARGAGPRIFPSGLKQGARFRTLCGLDHRMR
jgi:hypothetical protein